MVPLDKIRTIGYLHNLEFSIADPLLKYLFPTVCVQHVPSYMLFMD